MALDQNTKYSQEIYKTENDEDQRLTLAFENLDHLPPSLFNSFSRCVKILDLSHNNFSELSCLKHFPGLTSLILDHNKVSSATVFPILPSLEILWLNHNQISQLFPFIQRLRKTFPNLKFLSLMANEAVPLNIDESTFYQHLQYRLFIISWFPALEHLDDQPVSIGERAEAERLYKRPLLERLANKQPVQKAMKSMSAVLGLAQKHDHSGKRPIGLPKARWWHQVQKDMRLMGLTEEDAKDWLDGDIMWKGEVPTRIPVFMLLQKSARKATMGVSGQELQGCGLMMAA